MTFSGVEVPDGEVPGLLAVGTQERGEWRSSRAPHGVHGFHMWCPHTEILSPKLALACFSSLVATYLLELKYYVTTYLFSYTKMPSSTFALSPSHLQQTCGMQIPHVMSCATSY